jgi:hypothetical protein
MHFGGAMFFTDYSMAAPELARALEERGFESVWAPEHSHIPLSRKTPFPGGGDLPRQYYDAMDPFVVLAAAAQATSKIKLGTGVALVQQRDAIQTAKLVASLDQASQGRFLFGVGGGWNQDKAGSRPLRVEKSKLGAMRLGCDCWALHGGDVTQTFCWVCRRKMRALSGAGFARCAWLGAVGKRVRLRSRGLFGRVFGLRHGYALAQ